MSSARPPAARPPAPPPTGLPPCGAGAGDSPGGPDESVASLVHQSHLTGPAGGVSRRAFIGAAGGGAAALSLDSAATAAQTGGTSEDGPAAVAVTLNGERREFSLDPRVSLLDLLREREGLTGTKKGCDHGSCGACTVHVERPGDDEPTRQLACLTFAATLDGATVTTIEGLPGTANASGDDLHPLQDAFLRCDAYQCGYCTPGQIMSGAGLIAEGHAGSREEVREWMSGNLCRCAAYPNIVAAVRQAAGEEPEGDPSEAAVILSADDPEGGN